MTIFEANDRSARFLASEWLDLCWLGSLQGVAGPGGYPIGRRIANRSVGLPARHVYGLRIAKSDRGYKSFGLATDVATKRQHCRAEVYSREHGWVPVETADVRKEAERNQLVVVGYGARRYLRRIAYDFIFAWAQALSGRLPSRAAAAKPTIGAFTDAKVIYFCKTASYTLHYS